MTQSADRRTVLAGAVALVATGITATAQTADIHGTVSFESDAKIPEGQIRLSLENPAVADAMQRRIAEMQLHSDGTAHSIAFSMTLPAPADNLNNLVIVARLERADRWLIARGRAPVTSQAAVEVTLNTAMYSAG